MIHITNTQHGFEVQDANGNFLAWCEHFEEALQAMRDIDEAEEIRRVRDDVKLATKQRCDGDHFYSKMWTAA